MLQEQIRQKFSSAKVSRYTVVQCGKMIIGAPFVVYGTQCNLVIEWCVRLLSGSMERLPFAYGKPFVSKIIFYRLTIEIQ